MPRARGRREKIMLMSVEFQFGMMVVARVARVNVHIATEHKKCLK